ncbi:Putative acetyltransferase [Roseimaritima multifibrata]|uniref:Acetyltransferase n=1 Tax=Roseimaritima multifibrata TaxID=1930274 RepID=A0A517MN97_9BACT|nr:acyltransferase [Roseimaritima multifibrata]QDS96356.1 Putative acetyltransferase [Roseimaritima multifibrata]
MIFYRLFIATCDRLAHSRGLMLRILLRGKCFSIGKKLKCERGVKLLVRDGGKIEIGDRVEIRRDVEIRAFGNAHVIIDDDVRLDRGVRIIAGNASMVRLGKRVRVGFYSVLNGGDSITVGSGSLVSGFVYLQTSMHRHERNANIQDQGYSHSPIFIGEDVWIGAHSTVLPGIRIEQGGVVGSNAVVTKNVSAFDVVAGVPARVLRNR